MSESLPNFDRGLGFLMSDISRLLRKEFDRRVRGSGLTRAQWLLLYHIARAPDASQSDLADSLQLEKITVSRHAARLERARWLERRDDATDSRSYRLKLAPRAVRMILDFAEVSDQLRDDAMDGINPARRIGLIDDLLHIKANLLRMEMQAKQSHGARDTDEK